MTQSISSSILRPKRIPNFLTKIRDLKTILTTRDYFAEAFISRVIFRLSMRTMYEQIR